MVGLSAISWLPSCYGYGLEARKLRRYEKQLTKSFDYSTLTTQGELEEFKKLDVAIPSTVIPNGVDSSYFQPDPKPRNSRTIAFVGRMDYFPNIDGATYFAKDIFPLVRQRAPGAELWLVGSNPSRMVRDLGAIPGVKVTGHVADVRPYLSQASLTVAPLRLARGTQNKILESMATGTPVVATAMAAKGVAAIPGKHLLVADDPAHFAAEVSRILEMKLWLHRSLNAHADKWSMRIPGRVPCRSWIASWITPLKESQKRTAYKQNYAQLEFVHSLEAARQEEKYEIIGHAKRFDSDAVQSAFAKSAASPLRDQTSHKKSKFSRARDGSLKITGASRRSCRRHRRQCWGVYKGVFASGRRAWPCVCF